MATHVQVHFNEDAGGPKRFSKAQKNGGGGLARKPLGEISNSVKRPSLINQASKKPNSMNLNFVKDDNNGSSIGGKKSFSKPQEKKMPTVTRKPLGDISNSRKPSMQQPPKKGLTKNLNVLVEEPLHFADEKFLHNHNECIKAQRTHVDMNYFLNTVALDEFSSIQLSSQTVHPTLSVKSKDESPPKCMEVEEIAELMLEDWSPRSSKTGQLGKLTSSPCCKSPESPKLGWSWKDDDFSEFRLLDSPKLQKY